MREQKIVIGFDGSPAAQAALDWALDEANRTGTPAELVYADEWPVWAPAASMVPSPALRPASYVDEVIVGMLDKAVAAAREAYPLVTVTATTIQALPSTALARRSEQAGMIVLGSRDHHALAGLLGSVGAAVGAHAQCPVVVIRGNIPDTAPVVAGIDGSPAAAAVLRFAAEQAAGRKVALRVVRTWPATRPGATLAARTVTATEREPFDALVNRIRDEFPDLDLAAEAVRGDPARVLASFAEDTQLLVVGSRGRDAVRGMVFGSVSRHLLRHTRCPIAIVHEPGATAGAS
ncbi:universal stress protein [Actinoplanes cyaneus]|uniref:Universal stress protein n=1 Tax=Actinoplanes cyaneus TaxID=52696 RepID=A0A919M985_9ACTN|nr:universal stress protein [Actinoplanes cyaneus]MCW2141199.1 Nucleotide-binding universal stress protein, UspA family [Actinoplanes cyaneus]GID67264.1 universal stress protein [Actinoplanes cyaneus]